MSAALLARALPAADWAIGAADGCTRIEVRKLRDSDKHIVVICNADGTVKHVNSTRGMALDRAKAHATYLAGLYC